MDEDSLEELFSAYRDGEMSEDEWVEATTPQERMQAVMQHGTPSDEEIMTMEQLVVAAEISDENTSPDDVGPIDPDTIDGPSDIDLSNTSDRESE